jgi:7-cyano-7-deazaguanine reductase
MKGNRNGTTTVTTNRQESSTALEAFGAPQTEQITTFETDELTALCPFDFGGPDYYQAIIRYEADDLAVESRSLKRYLQSFRDREISAESLADELYREVRNTIDPARLYVRLEQARRGGIEETVEVGDVDLS